MSSGPGPPWWRQCRDSLLPCNSTRYTVNSSFDKRWSDLLQELRYPWKSRRCRAWEAAGGPGTPPAGPLPRLGVRGKASQCPGGKLTGTLGTPWFAAEYIATT